MYKLVPQRYSKSAITHIRCGFYHKGTLFNKPNLVHFKYLTLNLKSEALINIAANIKTQNVKPYLEKIGGGGYIILSPLLRTVERKPPITL